MNKWKNEWCQSMQPSSRSAHGVRQAPKIQPWVSYLRVSQGPKFRYNVHLIIVKLDWFASLQCFVIGCASSFFVIWEKETYGPSCWAWAKKAELIVRIPRWIIRAGNHDHVRRLLAWTLLRNAFGSFRRLIHDRVRGLPRNILGSFSLLQHQLLQDLFRGLLSLRNLFEIVRDNISPHACHSIIVAGRHEVDIAQAVVLRCPAEGWRDTDSYIHIKERGRERERERCI